MKIIKTSQSRLSKTDFSNLPFGRVFSDHMLICNFKNNNFGRYVYLFRFAVDLSGAVAQVVEHRTENP